MSCDLQIMANLQKKIQNASIHLPQTYPYAFVRACLYLWLDAHHIFNGGTSDSKLSPYLYCPRQYHVCVLLQWCTLHGISVLLYVESTFCPAIIIYHSSHSVFLSSIIPKNTCAREKNQSEQQKIRSLITENPPSRNRKPRFASPQKQSTAPSLGVRPYVPYRLRRSLRLQLRILCNLCSRGKRQARTSNLLSLCSYVSRVSGCPAPLRRQPLCFLRPPGR